MLKKFVVGPYQTNCYILGCDQTGEGVVIDPGDDVRVYPGHGPASTIGRERRTNPFFRLSHAC
ncbi:MAG: hypothetical protein JRH06_01160 [Deltaproteobacteria bacterium]|nr:hypothetical protein [Deltaproteobacteria bacterium]